ADHSTSDRRLGGVHRRRRASPEAPTYQRTSIVEVLSQVAVVIRSEIVDGRTKHAARLPSPFLGERALIPKIEIDAVADHLGHGAATGRCDFGEASCLLLRQVDLRARHDDRITSAPLEYSRPPSVLRSDGNDAR